MYELDIQDSRLYEYLEAGQEEEPDEEEDEDDAEYDYVPPWKMEW